MDRSTYPTTLTPAGRVFREQAADVLRHLNETRTFLRRDKRTPDQLHIVAAHTLAITFYPRWVAKLQRVIGRFSTRLVATNVHDAVLALLEGDCDLLLCYHHERLPVLLDPDRFTSVLVDHERFLPVSVPGNSGGPLYALPGRRSRPIPLVAYSTNSYLGRAMELALQNTDDKQFFERHTVTEMSETIKGLVLEGLGMAWLPESTIAREVKERRLVRAAGDKRTIELEVRFFRALDNRNSVLERVWKQLIQASTNTHDGLFSMKHRRVTP